MIDSTDRCPNDGKRMVYHMPSLADGEAYGVHECLHCDYSRPDTEPWWTDGR